MPAKGLNAGLFFVAFPVVAFFLLHGGGLSGFGVSWTVGLLAGLASSIAEAGFALARAAQSSEIFRPLLNGLATPLIWLGLGLSYLISPLTWLRDQIQASGQPVWIDFAATAAIVSILLFLLSGGIRTGWRALSSVSLYLPASAS